MYRIGLGVDENYLTAVIWYRKAAEQGYATAQNNFGLVYRKRLGVDENYTTTVISYHKASEQGNAHALNYFGMMNGNGVDKNYPTAAMYIYIYDIVLNLT